MALKTVLFVVLGLLCQLGTCPVGLGAVISSTANQIGDQLPGLPRLVKVAQFSFAGGYTPFTSISLRVTLNQLDDVQTARLILVPVGDSPTGHTTLDSGLDVGPPSSTSGVQAIATGWVAAVDGGQLATFVNTNLTFDAWLASNDSDFHAPAASAVYTLPGPMLVHIPYEAVLSFQSMPEPGSLVSWLGVLSGVFTLRRRRL